jgi:hypothetical protein
MFYRCGMIRSAPAAPISAGPLPLLAADVVRGVCRMLWRHDLIALPEVPLAGGRRADLMAIDARGCVVIIEVKVSRADLLGDGKWTDYLDHCDRYFWAVPDGFDTAPLMREGFLPERTGVIVADRYDAAILREAATHSLPAPVRRKLTLAFARRAAIRAMALADPEAAWPREE